MLDFGGELLLIIEGCIGKNGGRYVHPRLLEVCDLIISQFLIGLYWVNMFGDFYKDQILMWHGCSKPNVSLIILFGKLLLLPIPLIVGKAFFGTKI